MRRATFFCMWLAQLASFQVAEESHPEMSIMPIINSTP